MTEQYSVDRNEWLKQQQLRDDEIDLAELACKVWSRKWWVVACTVVAIALASLYILIAKPVYKAELYLMPPAASELSAVNLSISGAFGTPLLENAVTPEEAYGQYLNQLRSREQQFAFFREHDLAKVYGGEGSSTQKAFEAFQKRLSVNVPSRGEAVFTSLSLEGFSAPELARLTNNYAQRARDVVSKRLVAGLNSKRDRKLEILEKEIETKRELAEQMRLDRIEVLEEALAIAEAVGLEKLGESAERIGNEQSINILNTDTLFTRGADALRAEIAVLRARKSDDAFIGGLRRLQENIKNLKAIRVDAEQVQPVRIDLEATAPEKPIKPKKLLILAAAVVLGGMLGLFIALVVPARREADS
ncbi:LPS O-antigen chain length determinant protein WzzB [Motiliproteus sp. SC1-56]|uniref:LPS O-antigen chain length determinant protein WzzB n=1 Tax=Motiliproteus sp. SC1-56 TaxID=2799565 RepID=UPI001A8D6CA9|nr:Wzz/FepE/Etk N-terminal domain-containing protein [Motiliproteus sp. SC1-56]